MNDLGRWRGNYRGDVVGFRLGLVPAGSGGFWLASRVPKSVGRIVNSVLLTVPDGVWEGCGAGIRLRGGEGGAPQQHVIRIMGRYV